MIDLLVRSTLLMAMIWLAAGCVRKAGGSAAMRHMIWLAGLGALLLLPAVAALLPPLQLPILPATASPPPEILVSAPLAAAPAVPAPRESVGAGDLYRLLYLAVALALLGRFALGHVVLARLWRRARPADGARWSALLGGLKTDLGIRRQVALRIAAGPTMPMTWGTLRPRILLPAEAAGWTDERRRIVLLHELAHIARHDSLSRWAGSIVCMLYWFHPAIWFAARRMRLEQEHACDDLVLAQGARPSAYARDLLDIAGTLKPAPLAAGLSVAMARPTQLEQRLTAIVRRRPRRRSPAAFVAGSGAAAMLATWLVATAAPVAANQPAPVRPPVVPVAAAPQTPPAIPSPPAPAAAPSAVQPVSPVSPSMSARPLASVSPEDYDAAFKQYQRDLDVYNRQLEQYRLAVAAHNRRVDELSDQDNLANSGNTGNSGNSGNSGNPGRPAFDGRPAIPPTMPVAPTPPTAPTPPQPRYAPSQGP